MSDFLQKVRAAKANLKARESALADLRTTRNKHERQLAVKRSEFADSDAADDEQAAAEFLDNVTVSTAEIDKRAKARASRHRQLRAMTDAIALSAEREADAKAEVEVAQQALNVAVVHHVNSIKSEAAQKLRGIQDSAAAPLAMLAAAEMFQADTLGTRFTLPGSVAPTFSGSQVARKFLDGLSSRIRPASLENSAFDDAVQAQLGRLKSTMESVK